MSLKQTLAQIRHLDLVTNRKVTEMFSGNYKSAFKGQGIEMSDVREYNYGDDARHVDWKVTARLGRPHIKQYQEARELSVMVVVDLSASMNFSSTGKLKKEQALEMVAAILFSALKNGDRFGAILFSEEIEIYIPPQKGKAHLIRILREVISGFEKNAYKKSNQIRAFQFLNTVFRRRSLCFFIGDELAVRYESQLRVATRKHDFIFLNVYDPFERAVNMDDYLEIEDPETGEQMIIDLSNKKIREQFFRLRESKYLAQKKLLRRNQIEHLEIGTDEDVYKKLLLFFRKRKL